MRRSIDLAAAAGLKVVIGTPTAAPPAWLTQRYPDTVAVNEHGVTMQHGIRCHFDVTSERYQTFCASIAGALAREFGHDDSVIG